MMKKLMAIICVLCVCVCVAEGEMVGFDDLSGNVQVTDQYASLGILFENTWEMDAWNTSYAPVKHTGDHIAYSNGFNYSNFIFPGGVTSFSLLVTASNSTLTSKPARSGRIRRCVYTIRITVTKKNLNITVCGSSYNTHTLRFR